MTATLNPAAPQHPPAFIAAPGETDVLMWIAAAILVCAVLAFGLLFLRLHTLPERIAHKGHKLQFEIVAVLGLIALFTHVHLFWVIGLLLALIDIPDFGGVLGRMARALERIAGSRHGDGAITAPRAHSDEAGIGSSPEFQSVQKVGDAIRPAMVGRGSGVVTPIEDPLPSTRPTPTIVPASTGS